MFPLSSAVRAADSAQEHESLLVLPTTVHGTATPLVPFSSRVESLDAMYAAQRAQGALTIESVWIMLFYSPPSRTSQLTTWERWAIAKHCGGITHIEFAFCDSEGRMMAFTVDRVDKKVTGSGRVRVIYRDPAVAYPLYGDDGDILWTHRHVSSLSAAERIGLMEFCYRQVGKPMDNWGMFMNFLPMLGTMFVGESRDEEDTYYCSQLVACALRWIRPRQFATVDTRRCTPIQLVRLLDANRDMFLTASFRPVSSISLGGGADALL